MGAPPLDERFGKPLLQLHRPYFRHVAPKAGITCEVAPRQPTGTNYTDQQAMAGSLVTCRSRERQLKYQLRVGFIARRSDHDRIRERLSAYQVNAKARR